MELFAIAGGAPPSGEVLLNGCGVICLLPFFLFLVGWAVARNAVWAALLALVLVGLPYLMLWNAVAGYQPSDDGDVMSDQAAGREALTKFTILVVIAAAAVVWSAIGWIRRWRNPPAPIGPEFPGDWVRD
jgi:hypothetical protein